MRNSPAAAGLSDLTGALPISPSSRKAFPGEKESQIKSELMLTAAHYFKRIKDCNRIDILRQKRVSSEKTKIVTFPN